MKCEDEENPENWPFWLGKVLDLRVNQEANTELEVHWYSPQSDFQEPWVVCEAPWLPLYRDSKALTDWIPIESVEHSFSSLFRGKFFPENFKTSWQELESS